MASFSEHEKAIAARLQPLRQVLASDNIPVASLPQEAAKFTENYPGSIRILVGHSYRGKEAATTGQKREIDCAVYIRLPKRYDDAPPEIRDPAIEWVEGEIIKHLLGYLLPTAVSEMLLVSGRLMAPEEGEWQKEVAFKFQDFIYYQPEEEDDTLFGARIFDVVFTAD